MIVGGFEFRIDSLLYPLDETTIETGYFFKEKTPYVDINKDDGQIYFRENIKLNSFLEQLGIREKDVLKAINGQSIIKENYRDPILATLKWKPGMNVSFLIERNGNKMLLIGRTFQPTELLLKIIDKNPSKDSKEFQLRQSWLRN